MNTAIELRHLRSFLVVADELHFGRAAARIAVSQPALTVQIQQLEAAAGALLLDRHSRHVALTDAGRVFADAAARILRDVNAALDDVRQAQAGEVGVLRVGFSPTLMLSTLAHVVRTYRTRYPRVRLELRELATAEQMDALVRGDLDVGIMRGADAHPRLHSELFALEPLLIAMNRDHPLAPVARVRLSALAGEPWVLFPRAIAPQLYDQVLGLCHAAGFTPDVVQESREVYTTVGLVGAGVGVTIIPETVQRMSWGDVVYKPIPRAAIRLSMVTPKQSRSVVDTFLAIARRSARRPGVVR